MITSYLISRKLPFYRILIGGTFSACYVLLVVYQNHSSIISSPIIKLLYSVLIIVITFGYQTVNKLIVSLIYFYLSTFTIGGIILGINYFLTTSIIYEKGYLNVVNSTDKISLIFILICFPVASYFYIKNFITANDIKSFNNLIYDVEISFKEVVIKCSGLLDTGNNLSEPILKTPVIVIDCESVKEQLPEMMFELLKSWSSKMAFPEEENIYVEGIKLIPYSAIGSNNKILLGYTVNYIKSKNNHDSFICENAIVAFSTTRISIEKDFQCILHPKCLKNTTNIA
jgi:stage II sporulation protein GA (sporulation sigma-E factor processing peptidase)